MISKGSKADDDADPGGVQEFLRRVYDESKKGMVETKIAINDLDEIRETFKPIPDDLAALSEGQSEPLPIKTAPNDDLLKTVHPDEPIKQSLGDALKAAHDELVEGEWLVRPDAPGKEDLGDLDEIQEAFKPTDDEIAATLESEIRLSVQTDIVPFDALFDLYVEKYEEYGQRVSSYETYLDTEKKLVVFVVYYQSVEEGLDD